ncbi:hypothetical protein [Pyxidicoccus xibeiensis]|uniref:hypothetical protein n=1 Tax=Pyxidicoccus xibeiensis TaxID=2906759 RepID=UPI0020A7EAD2|nr:hypothetical protein [Pyxidicoccus xibeiensis]MCP3138362.1 hypothetical protein [Pyxidicoccus xibeiensis]
MFEGFSPSTDAPGDFGQSPEQGVHAAGLSCPSGTASWSQQQWAAWNSNVNTVGTYSCSGNVFATSDGSNVSVMAAGGERSGTAQLRCSNGTWLWVSGTCDGKVVNTTVATGHTMVCSHSDPVRSKWIGWYVAALKRCADSGGLEWWVAQYNSNNGCLASTNYDGYGSKDACFRANFQISAGSSYTEAQSTGRIAAQDEYNICGPRGAYPWNNIFGDGMKCKYRP